METDREKEGGREELRRRRSQGAGKEIRKQSEQRGDVHAEEDQRRPSGCSRNERASAERQEKKSWKEAEAAPPTERKFPHTVAAPCVSVCVHSSEVENKSCWKRSRRTDGRTHELQHESPRRKAAGNIPTELHADVTRASWERLRSIKT